MIRDISRVVNEKIFGLWASDEEQCTPAALLTPPHALAYNTVTTKYQQGEEGEE
jgi:hypothetical protein